MSSIDFAKAAKAKKLQRFFQEHGRIYIVVDATQIGVVLPEHLTGDPALNLVLNIRMPQSIHITEEILTSNLSFGGQGFACTIPMDAIWAAYAPDKPSEEGLFWDEVMPEAVINMIEAIDEDDEEQEPVVIEKKDTTDKETKPVSKKSHLRVVK